MRKLSERSSDRLLNLPYWKKKLLRPLLWLTGIVLAIYAVMLWAQYQAFPYKTVYEMTWSGAGLDPSSSNFVPQVVVLAGSVSEVLTRNESYPSKPKVDQFEITMRGHDYYHRTEWKNGRAPRWYIVLHAGRFWADHGMKLAGSGYRPTGLGAGFSTNVWPAVGRRLWEGTNFIGATSGSVFHSYFRFEDFSEQFLDLKQYGPFKIPMTILYKGWPGDRLRRYSVETVTFRSDPGTNWFVAERNRMFPDTPETETKFARGLTNSLPAGRRIFIPHATSP